MRKALLALLIFVSVSMALRPLAVIGQGSGTDSSDMKGELERLKLDARRSSILGREAERESEALSAAMEQIEKEISTLQKDVESISAAIEATRVEIETTDKEIKRVELEFKKKHLILKTRLRSMYKRRNLSMIDMLFGGGSLTAGLNRMNYFARIANMDREIFIEVRELWDSLKAASEKLEKKHGYLTRLLDQQKNSEESLVSNRSDKEVLLKKVRHRAEVLRKRVAEQEKAAAAMERTIAEAIKKAETKPVQKAEPLKPVREIAPDAANADKARMKPAIGEGKDRARNFVWPTGSIDAVSELWGRSVDKLSGTTRFNPGIRIKVKPGITIKCCGDGAVVYKGRMEGYGLFVIINHGDDLVTVYAQLDEAMVRVGQLVAQEDKIGITSDEPFHFEVRKSSETQNPLNWLL